MIVADTNVVVAFIIASETTSLAQRARRKDRNWVLPPVWRAEYASALSKFTRSSKPVLEWPQAHAAWQKAAKLLAEAERDVDGELVLRLLREHPKLSPYDAQFLALAHQHDTVLVTNDLKSLADAVPDPRIVRLTSFVSS